MKINASDTQRKAYKEVIESGLIQKENLIVLEALKRHQPCTRRELHHLTGLEISNLCRCLFNLVNANPPKRPLVEVAFTAKCKTTGKQVYYYKLAGDDQTSCPCRLNSPPDQPSLFAYGNTNKCCQSKNSD